MCGIAGIVSNSVSREIATRALGRMTKVLQHRGPDDWGVHLAPSEAAPFVGLGHQRLAIIDLSTGHQPMANEDDSIWIVFNGEIYNHQELRKDLIAMGHCYRTNSDTETVIHAYEEYGDACVEKLRGMFAFAIWDDRKKRLFAARDRFGIKPFYYANPGATLLFASEVKSILASGLLQPGVNHRALPEYFALGQTVDDATLFAGVKKLMPGHTLIYDGREIHTQRYWDWTFDEPRARERDENYVERFIELLDHSVRLHLLSDVPLGVFLSGGLDSSLIAALMAKHLDSRVKTFSVGFEEKYYSELGYSRRVARHIGAEHHEVTLTPVQLAEILPKLVWHEDEPLKGAASVALYMVSQLARRHVKVVLTGEGSDELFAGYNDRYWGTLLDRRMAMAARWLFPEPARKHLVRKQLWKMPLPLSVKKKISHTVLYLSNDMSSLFFENFHGIFSREMQRDLVDDQLRRGISGSDPLAHAMALLERPNSRHFLHHMLYADANSDLVELLMKQDQMSMAASLESRVPFLDHVLAEFAGTLPPNMRLRGRKGKWLVKKAAEKFLPHEIVHRPKMGFPVPFETWIREDRGGFVRDTILSERARSRGYFKPAYIEELFEWHRSGRRDCHSQIWMLLNFEIWHRVFFDGAAAASNVIPLFSEPATHIESGRHGTHLRPKPKVNFQ